MFLHLSVSHSVHTGVYPSMQWVGRYIPLTDAPQTGTLPVQTPILHGDNPPGQTLPRQKPLGRPPSVDPPLRRQLKRAACTPLERSLVFFY